MAGEESQLEKAAARSRARAAKRQEKLEKKPLSAATKRKISRAILEESLGGTPDTTVASYFLGGGIGVAILFGWVFFTQDVLEVEGDFAALAINMPGWLASLYILYTAKRSFLFRWRRRAIRRIGFGFDADAYLERLSEKRRRGTLVANVRFVEPFPADRRETAAQAINGWETKLHADWKDERSLVVRSDEIDCTGSAITSYGSHRWFTNHELHRLLMALVNKALPPVDETAAIAELDATIDGDVCPIDESAKMF